MIIGIFGGRGLPSAPLCLEIPQEKGIFSRMGVHRNGFEVLSMGSSVRTHLLTPSSGKSDGRPRDTFHKESLGAWASIVKKKKISKQNDEESQGDILKIKRFREQRV